MKYRKLTLTLIGLVLITSFVYSQNSPNKIVEDFFETFQTESISKALDELYNTNPWIERNLDAVTKLKNEMEGLNLDYVGKYYGYEMITEKIFQTVMYFKVTLSNMIDNRLGTLFNFTNLKVNGDYIALNTMEVLIVNLKSLQKFTI